MNVEYYAIRRVSPYLGMLQVVDVGGARAYSSNGRRWQVRKVHGRVPIPEEERWGDDPPMPVDAPDHMRAALAQRPQLPFPAGDRYELWLLRRSTLRPLALLQTARWRHELGAVRVPTWRALTPGERPFRAPCLDGTVAPGRHAGVLERQVNLAARPMPVAQWFERHPDGGGTGLFGLRVEESGLTGCRLGAEAFPELLIDESWDSERDARLAAVFHDWNASLLLAHHNLTRATRARLETAAQCRPGPLPDIYRMIPEVLDRDAMRVALVAARLMRA